MPTRLYIPFLSLLVLAALAFGFWVVGSPAHARKRALDNQRVEQMTALVSEINRFYRNKKRLPERIDSILASRRDLGKPDKNVRYRIIDAAVYELGATFLTDEKYEGYYREGQTAKLGDHPKGEAWFRFDATAKEPYE